MPAAPDADAGGSFPVTVAHALGETVVPGEPQRVVTLGPQSLDTVLALGVQPAGAVLPFYTQEPLPWQQPHLDDATTLIPGAPDFTPNYEAIAALDPDLIVGPDLFTMPDAYSQLSEIAPTVAYAENPQTDDWETTTRLVGTALGRTADTDRLLAELDTEVTATRDAHPGAAGRTWSLSVATGPDGLGVLVNPQDPLAVLLGELGLRQPEGVTSLEAGPGGVAPISLEQVRAVEADLMIVVHPAPDVQEALEGNPLFAGIPAVGGPGYLGVDLVTGTGLRTPSLLALPWSLDQLDPALAAIAEG
ncbi:ABC transporter substrate-binding protein [Pseudonocardia sp. NPDC049635]|uniref:ABC transporter substrate-binding protein n=1 Tax=Pseudonocardia sp. NPDC049635 TaxID=3155506 RepID=UPI0033F34A79